MRADGPEAFFSVVTIEEALGAYEGLTPTGTETVGVDQALGRVIAGGLDAPVEVPHLLEVPLPQLRKRVFQLLKGTVPLLLIREAVRKPGRVHSQGLEPSSLCF